MGCATDLHCDACGYVVEYMVHGFDCGEVSFVHSVTCADCRELRVASLPPFPPLASAWDHYGPGARVDFARMPPLRCPESDAHRVAPWYHPGPCPRCGAAELRAGDRFIIWD